jgi:hypothetical protein
MRRNAIAIVIGGLSIAGVGPIGAGPSPVAPPPGEWR